MKKRLLCLLLAAIAGGLSAKAGYQYSGISGDDAVLSLGIIFRIK